MQRQTHAADYFRLGETLRDGLRLARGPALRVRRRNRATPPGPLADHAGPAPRIVVFGPGRHTPITHTDTLRNC